MTADIHDQQKRIIAAYLLMVCYFRDLYSQFDLPSHNLGKTWVPIPDFRVRISSGCLRCSDKESHEFIVLMINEGFFEAYKAKSGCWYVRGKKHGL